VCIRHRAHGAPRHSRRPTGGPIKGFYYGAFLDINRIAPVLPQGGMVPTGNANGRWPPSGELALEPLRQAFVRNNHQCLVAEKAAQRNISWSYAANKSPLRSLMIPLGWYWKTGGTHGLYTLQRDATR
jgi:hypothetical protein